uniref:Uncharacterized protein n=1 Tax=Siphoviridae sp. ctlgF9 TaxID=2825649 RepID=A0A8S5PUC4_9CAUD|nr:MAG TPA: hypothetical protein [Siphoviridae sp. ctlgF9]
MCYTESAMDEAIKQGQMPSTVYRKLYWVDGICF